MRLRMQLEDGSERNMTVAELKIRAKRQDDTGRKAIMDLIDIKGGFDVLTQTQINKITKWLLYGGLDL